MKFLFDENVHNSLVPFLRKLGYDVKLVPKTIENSKVFELALKEQRLLITRDKHFLEDIFISSEHFGIWILRVPAKDLESQKKIISKLLSSNKEFKGRVVRLVSAEKFEFRK